MDKNNVKILFCVIAIITILIVMFIVVFTKVNNKKNIFLNDENVESLAEYFVLYVGDNAGVIDKKGNIIIDAKYEEIYIPNDAKDVFFCYYDDENYDILNKENNKIFANMEISAIQINSEYPEFEKNALKYKKDDLFGLIDFDGNVIVEPQYSKIGSLKNKPGVLYVCKDEKYGIIDQKGDEIIPAIYDGIIADGYSSEKSLYSKTGYITAIKSENGKNFGYYDCKGNLIIEPKYETISRVKCDDILYLIAMQNGKKGVLREDKKIIDFNFQNIEYKSNIFVVNKNGKYGFYSSDGKNIIKAKYSEYAIAGNYISVQNGENVELYDTNGNLVNTNGYTKMIETENSEYFIAQNTSGYYSIINKDVNIENDFTNLEYAFDNYFIYKTETGYGIVNAQTEEYLLQDMFDYIWVIDGINAIETIDTTTNTVEIYSSEIKKTVEMQNAVVSNLNDNYAIVYSENDVKYINSNGEVVLNTEVYKDKKIYAYKQNEKWGYIDTNENIIVECKYDIVTELNDYGFAGIRLDGKWGVIDENGQVIVEPIYEIDTFYFPQFIGKYLLQQYETTFCEEI